MKPDGPIIRRQCADAAPHDLTLWYSRVVDADLSSVRLTCDERDRLRTLRRENDRRSFAVGCALARLVAAHLLAMGTADVELRRDCESCGGGHGPIGAAGIRSMSLTRRRDVVAVAASQHCRIGVDIEAEGSLSGFDLKRFDAAVSHPNEPPASTDPALLLERWTAKEAILKASGVGLRCSMRAISAHVTDLRMSSLDAEAAPTDVLGSPAVAMRTTAPAGHVLILAALTSASVLRVASSDVTPLIAGEADSRIGSNVHCIRAAALDILTGPPRALGLANWVNEIPGGDDDREMGLRRG